LRIKSFLILRNLCSVIESLNLWVISIYSSLICLESSSSSKSIWVFANSSITSMKFFIFYSYLNTFQYLILSWTYGLYLISISYFIWGKEGVLKVLATTAK
jgi:hypothetical protein